MSYKIKLISEARLDIKDTIDWYNEQRVGLGRVFYQSVKSKMHYIKINPLHYQISYRNVRSALVNKFPYQVHYHIEKANKSIIVLAILHTSRDPQVLNKRK